MLFCTFLSIWTIPVLKYTYFLNVSVHLLSVTKEKFNWLVPRGIHFLHPGPASQLSCFAVCLQTLINDLGYLKGNVFSIRKALDPGFSVMAAKEILPPISYRTPAAVRQGKKPACPENNLSRHQQSSSLGQDSQYKVSCSFSFSFWSQRESLWFMWRWYHVARWV